MNFSIVFPSRERVGLLTNLLQSIVNTTADISNVDVHVGIDNDDSATCDACPRLEAQFPFVKFHCRDRSPFLNRDYINWMLPMSTGKYIIVCNDDAEFKTHHWDTIAMGHLGTYMVDKPDGIVYAYISDAILNRYGLAYCCFPLISRVAANTVGWLMPPQLPSWNADVWTWRLYLSVGRVLSLSEIMIQHISYHSGLRDRDAVSHNVEHLERTSRPAMNIQPEIAKLAEAILRG
jgi:hypothetical protein